MFLLVLIVPSMMAIIAPNLYLECGVSEFVLVFGIVFLDFTFVLVVGMSPRPTSPSSPSSFAVCFPS